MECKKQKDLKLVKGDKKGFVEENNKNLLISGEAKKMMHL